MSEPDIDSKTAASAPENAFQPERWVSEHGDYLFRFALSRLRDPVRAEDMVQETFLAALKSGSSFQGRSSEKSWLTGILKNKIFDFFRKAGRETSFTDMEFYSDEESDRFEKEGFHSGGWIHRMGPQEWQNPGASLDEADFWKTLQECLSKLPKNVGAVFSMREIDGVESAEVCRILNITDSNLWVMLHRARMALRRCIETNWFAPNNETRSKRK